MRQAHQHAVSLLILTAFSSCGLPPEEETETIAGEATVPSSFADSAVASGITSPTTMAFAPDGRLFVCQQNGALRVIKNGALLSTPFKQLTVDTQGERGLLGVAFDPNWASEKWVYVYYTSKSGSIHNRVSRFLASGDVGGAEDPLIDLPTLSAIYHNGGALQFGSDGKLYIAVGDNKSSSSAQSKGSVLGKISIENRWRTRQHGPGHL